jgi:hypothetical protein
MRAPLRFVPGLEAAIKDSVLEADAAYFEKVDEVRGLRRAAVRSCRAPLAARSRASGWRAHSSQYLAALLSFSLSLSLSLSRPWTEARRGAAAERGPLRPHHGGL